MAPDSPRAPRDGDIRIVATAIVAVFGFVLGFVLTMTYIGVSPWEAVAVAIAAGTAAGTIAQVLQDLLPSGPPSANRRVPPEPTDSEQAAGMAAEAPTETKQQMIPPEPAEDI